MILVGANTGKVLTAEEARQQGISFSLGDRVSRSDGTVVMYVQAGDTGILENYCVSVDENFIARSLDTGTAASIAEGLLVGVATEPAATTDDQLWVIIYGPASVNVAASAAANVKLSPTATAGRLDDGGSTGDTYVDGLVLNTAQGGSAGDNDSAFLTYPKIALIGTYA